MSVSIMGLHYDPEHFPQPEVFDPDRFLPKQTLSRSSYVFLPFGVGPRNCIGKMDIQVLVYFLFNKTFDTTGRKCVCTCTKISESMLKKINMHYTTCIRDSETRFSHGENLDYGPSVMTPSCLIIAP